MEFSSKAFGNRPWFIQETDINMPFCISGGRRDLHRVRGDELAPHGGRAKHGLKAVEKIFANYDHWLASAGPAFGRGNCFNDWGHSTRINAWKLYYVII